MNKMKRKSIISVLLLGMMVGVFSTSCEDMLTPDSERHSYTVADDTLYSYWGILKSLQNLAERYVILNECRGDLVDETSFVSDTISPIVNFGETSDPAKWKDGACAYLRISDFYHVINSCNAYIAKCDTTIKTGTDRSYMVKEYAQVQAIRAWVYMQLLYAYGENRVPFYTEPMLTTDDIYNFVNDPNHPQVSVKMLAEKLIPELEKVEPVELDPSRGMPNYNYYSGVCHSTKCMFPVSIVLGDLCLLSGNYGDAARHYYNYINTENCGPLIADKYYSYGLLNDRKDNPSYSFTNYPYYETGAVSSGTEAITCIPSSIGKLDGRVLTDINRLFGFEAELSTVNATILNTKDDEVKDEIVVVSNVLLSRNYEHELGPSKGYESLCDDQTYEMYVGTYNGTKFDWTTCTLEELRSDNQKVGDARRAWIYASGGDQWTFRQGDDLLYGKMVSKQNPYGTFSTTYPVVYRKSTVWLRYAEALNRAGFPGYAFAVLKSGLCSNDYWLPTDPKSPIMVIEKVEERIPTDPNDPSSPVNVVVRNVEKYYSPTEFGFQFAKYGSVLSGSHYFEYPIKATDTLYYYRDVSSDVELEASYYRKGAVNDVILPKGWKDDSEKQMHTYAKLEAWLTQYFQDEYEASLATEEPMASPRTIDPNKVYFSILSEESFENVPHDNCGKVCYYIGRKEVERARKPEYSKFLDFKQPYLRGHNTRQLIFVKEQGKLLNTSYNTVRYTIDDDLNKRYTIGVHQRGCGFINCEFDSDKAIRSSYNYVDMVGKKLKDYGVNLTGDDLESYVYDESNMALVQNAVEDLIVDEMGLELAFEGTRFSDLCRVALHRRGEGAANYTDYLAKRVAKRHTGEVDEALRSRLNVMDNWWLPIPEK